MTVGDFSKRHKPIKMGRTGKETVSPEVWTLEGKCTSGKGLNISKKLNPKPAVKKTKPESRYIHHIIPQNTVELVVLAAVENEAGKGSKIRSD